MPPEAICDCGAIVTCQPVGGLLVEPPSGLLPEKTVFMVGETPLVTQPPPVAYVLAGQDTVNVPDDWGPEYD